MSTERLDAEVLDILLGAAGKTAKEALRGQPGWSDYVEWRAQSEQRGRSLVDRVVGRALAVAALGPDAATYGAVRRVRKALATQGAWLSPLEQRREGNPAGWVALEIGGGEGPDGADAARFGRWLAALEAALKATPTVGAVVTVSAGFISEATADGRDATPHGAAIDEALELVSEAIPGEVRLSPSAMRALGPLAASLGLTTVSAPPQDEPAYAGGSASPEAPLLWPVITAGLATLEVSAERLLRRDSGRGPLSHGDTLRFAVSTDAPVYAYVLLQREEHIEALLDGKAALVPDGPRHRELTFGVDRRPGVDRPLLLTAGRSLYELPGVVDYINRETQGTPSARVEQLRAALGGAAAGIEIVEAPPWAHAPDGALAVDLELLERGSSTPEEALALARAWSAQGQPSGVSAQLSLHITRALRALGQLPEAREAAGRAVELARLAGAVGLEALALGEIALLGALAPDLDGAPDGLGAADAWELSLHLARATSAPEIIAHAHLLRGEACLRRGDFDGAEGEARAGIEILGREHPSLRCRLWILGGQGARSAGRSDEAAAQGRMALALAYGADDHASRDAADRLLVQLAEESSTRT